ncbi:MAG: fibronectin type III domain-containing protein, partial [Patescibacteria group bacterium]|nr:fibronectin type III domain-containing protein [Patescibacteria group bacterium]
MHTRGNRHTAFFLHRRFLPHKTLPSFLMLLWSLFFAVVGGYYILQKFRVFAAAPLPPSHVISVNDDRFATIKWTPSPDSDTVGYKVTWTQNGETPKTLFTSYPDAQIVGLIPGKLYQVYVQSLNKNGDVSTSVGPVTAQSDSTYVSRIKQQMNGMFDDFNENPYNGLPDPTHWYTTVTNAANSSMAFVSGDQNQLQMFVQNDSSNKNKDRASITMRSLVPFDFTNRTGTMAFDFDFGQPATDSLGYQWSLTISPSRVDDITTDALYNGSQIINPMEAFQIHMENDTISFRKISNGVITGEWDSTYSHTHPLRDIGVLKHAIVKLTTDSAQLFVDGIQILSASNINLGFSKGWVYNQQLVFNLPKEHIPFVLSHFDNIGF